MLHLYIALGGHARMSKNIRIFSWFTVLFIVYLALSACSDKKSPPLSEFQQNKPIGLSSSASDSATTLSWASMADAVSYNLYWSNSPNVSQSNGNKIEGVTSPYQHTGLTNGTAYYYVLTGVNSKNENSSDSNIVKVTPKAPPPDAPANIQAIPGDQRIVLLWDSPPSMEPGSDVSYNIYWNTSGNVTSADHKVSGTSSPVVHTDLTNGAQYYYIVTAVQNGSESAPSAEVSTSPRLPPLTSPTHIDIMVAESKVTLNWDEISNAKSYNIYWNNTGNVTTADNLIANITPPYNHANLFNGTRYYYIIVATNSEGQQSPPSTEVSAKPELAPPGTPTNISVKAGQEQVIIKWDPVDKAVAYNIYWGTEPSATNLLPNKTSPFIHTGLTAGQMYYYWVTAIRKVNDKGNEAAVESTRSAQVSATPLAPPPSAPVNLSAVAGNGQISLKWDAVGNATTYNIYWNNTGNVTTADNKIAGATLPYVHTSLTNGNAYYYIVTAVNNDGEGSPSNQAFAIPATTKPQGSDLVIVAASADVKGSLTLGQEVHITYTIKNEGTQATNLNNTWANGFYVAFSLTNDLIPNHIFNPILQWNGFTNYFRYYDKTDWVKDLAPGESYTGTYTYFVNDLSPDINSQYYIKIIADAWNNQLEVNEKNNEKILIENPLSIKSQNPGADLVISDVGSLQSSAQTGDTITIHNTEMDIGNADILGHYIALYLTTDPNGTASNANIVGYRWVTGLTTGSSNTEDTKIVIPSYIATGTYYIAALANPWSIQNENNPGNNWFVNSANTIQITSSLKGPDLVVTNFEITGNRTSVMQGESFPVNLTIQNIGDMPTVSIDTTGYYIPKGIEAEIDYIDANNQSKTLLYATLPNLNPGESYTLTDWIIDDNYYYYRPSGPPYRYYTWFPTGTNHLLATVDPSNNETESDETNNTKELNINVDADDSEDLVISNLTLSTSQVGGGDNVTITYTVTNQGTSDTWGSFVGLELISDSDPTKKYERADMWVPNLPAGASMTEQLVSTIPFGLEGGYAIKAIADYYNNQTESNENNNERSVSLTIHKDIDLALSNVNLGKLNLAAGQTGTIGFTVTNVGTTISPESQIHAYLSKDGTSKDYLFKEGEILGKISPITPQQNVATDLVFTVPFDTPPGSYFVVLNVDQSLDKNNANNTINNKSLMVEPVTNGAIGSIIPSGVVSTDITSNSYFEANSTYDITADIKVAANAMLTIESGATLRFADGAGLVVDGALVVNGLPGQEVLFTSSSASPTKTSWQGIKNSSDYYSSSYLIMNYAVVQWATYGVYFNYSNGEIHNSRFENNQTAIYIEGESSPQITNGNVITSNDYGVVFSSSYLVLLTPVVTGNSIYNNAILNVQSAALGTEKNVTINAKDNWWGTTNIEAIRDSIGDYSSTTSNPAITVKFTPFLDGPNGIEVQGNYLDMPFFANDSILKKGTSYIVLEDLHVPVGINLTIEAGTNLQFFGSKSSLSIGGSLTAQGTQADPIVFTSGRSTPAFLDWEGVSIETTASSVTIDQALIEYARNGISFNGMGSISNSIVQNGDTGVNINNTSPSLIKNTIQNNQSGISITGNSNPLINGGNTITGNRVGIAVQGPLPSSTTGVNPNPLVNGNNIYNNLPYNYSASGFIDAANTTLDAKNNWWGSTDITTIQSTLNNISTDSPAIAIDPILQAPTP